MVCVLWIDLHLLVDTHIRNCGVVITSGCFFRDPFTHYQPLIPGALSISMEVIEKSARDGYCYQQ